MLNTVTGGIKMAGALSIAAAFIGMFLRSVVQAFNGSLKPFALGVTALLLALALEWWVKSRAARAKRAAARAAAYDAEVAQRFGDSEPGSLNEALERAAARRAAQAH